jgi:hypothetical protein
VDRGLILIHAVALISSGSVVAISGYIARHLPHLRHPGWHGFFITCFWSVGFVIFFGDVWILFSAVPHLDWLRGGPISWMTIALSGALEFALGLLFVGYPLLMQLTKRGEQVRLSLVPYQFTLGTLAIALGFLLWTAPDTVMVMGLITGIVLIALVLAAPSSITDRRPDAQSYIDALVPYQGWLGCLCSILILFNGVLHLNFLRSAGWGVVALVGAIEIPLGLLFGCLGYALLTKRGEQVPLYLTSLGYVAIMFYATFLILLLA